MTEKRKMANELYESIKSKEKISEELLYNAICYFYHDLEPQGIVKMLEALSESKLQQLSTFLLGTREEVQAALKATLASRNFDSAFHDSEIEEILFYQTAHGEDIH